jgi:hypothetical protein
MAKGVIVSAGGKTSAFRILKLDRTQLYGSRRRVAIDAAGRPCSRASLTSDGKVLLRSGMSAQGWFDADGRQVEQKAIAAIDDQGKTLELVPSTLGVEQALEGPISPRDVLDLAITAVYAAEAEDLDPVLAESLGRGEVWRFRFNYRPDYRAEPAVLLQNNEGAFILVGTSCSAPFLEPSASAPPADESEDEGDLDFEML